MRPQRLRIEGLASFREPVEIDFTGLELFAICGATGAGKSTILDAMLFALYGHVPRVGKHDLREMISSSRDRVSVMFDFAVGGAQYRITRTRRRTGAANVRLDRHDGADFNVNVADQVRSAEEKIGRLLGLNVDAFTQAVILPQGRFADFLKAEPREQRAILQELLRLSIYERMRDAAQRDAVRVKAALDQAQGLLEREYAGVTPAALAEVRARQAAAQEQGAARAVARDAAQRALGALEQRHALSDELARREAERAQLEAAAREIEHARAELAAARRAALLWPHVEDSQRAAAAAAKAHAEAQEAARAHESAARDERTAADALRRAGEAAAQVPALREHAQALNRVLGRLPERTRLERSAEAQRTALAQAQARAGEQQQRLGRMSAEAQHQEAALKASQERLSRSGFDAQLHGALDGVRDLAATLADRRADVARLETEALRQRGHLEELAQSVRRLEAATKKADAAETKAREGLAAAEQALHEAHRRDAANYLRGGLAAGAQCPVCEQVVPAPPAAGADPAVDRAEAQRAAAGEALRKATAAAVEAREKRTREAGLLQAAQGILLETESRLRESRERLRRQEQAVRAPLARTDDGSGERIEDWVAAQVARQAAARQQHEEASAQVQQHERALALNRQGREQLQVQLREAALALDAQAAKLRDEEDQLRALVAQIAAVTRAADPQAEHDALLARAAALEAAQRDAAATAGAAASKAGGLRQAHELRAQQAADAASAAQQRAAGLAAALQENGFPDAPATASARRSESQSVALDQRIRAHERSLHAAQERIAVLLGELGSERVTAEAVAGARTQHAALAQQADTLQREAAAAQADAEAMQRRLARARELQSEAEREGRAHRVCAQLATDLRNDRFQHYMLEETFAELVAAASARLLGLTGGRYALQFVDGGISVVDHDNADERRISDTLSGGETFLTSLALALALSEQVQRAAGAVRLDSLFIDEGFGTLDADTLAVVSEAIQGLQVGGRMVGIITHIPELRDEFRQQIAVSRGPTGSRVEVRREG